MKNTIIGFILFLSLFSVSSNAQVARGNYLLGGNLNLHYHSRLSSGTMLFQFNPNIGYFVGNKLALGINGSVNGSINKNFKSSNYMLSPYARYYFAIKENAALFTQLNAGVQFSKSIYSDSNHHTLDPYIGLGVGHTYFISKHIGLETQLYADNAFGEFNLGFGVGLQFYLGKKK